MATNVKQMLQLIQDRTCAVLPSEIQGESCMKDENGEDLLRLGIAVQRDIILSAGYEAAPDIPADTAACLAAVCTLMANRTIASAFLLTAADIASSLSDNGELDEANRPAAAIAALMARECLRNYSFHYNEARNARLGRKESS